MDASESHPHQLPQKGWYGGDSRERGKKGRGEEEMREEKEKEEREGKRAGIGENGRQGHPAHPLGWDCSELCLPFLSKREKKQSPPWCSCHREQWRVRLHTRCYCLCPRPAGRSWSLSTLIHNALRIRQACSFCVMRSTLPSPPLHAHTASVQQLPSPQSPLLPQSPQGAEQRSARAQGWPPLPP